MFRDADVGRASRERGATPWKVLVLYRWSGGESVASDFTGRFGTETRRLHPGGVLTRTLCGPITTVTDGTLHL